MCRWQRKLALKLLDLFINRINLSQLPPPAGDLQNPQHQLSTAALDIQGCNSTDSAVGRNRHSGFSIACKGEAKPSLRKTES